MEHKPFTKEQKALIDTCSWIIASWKHTNDNTSPTHGSDIETELKVNDLTNDEIEDLSNCLWIIFQIIKDYEPHKI